MASFTEKRLLDRVANKKARHIPVRQLVRRATNALQTLKPCFLMSPMSVAQYLPPGEIEFPDRSRSILAKEAMACVVRDGAYTEDMWFRSVSVLLRTKMDGRERQLFLDDMFQLVMEYT